MFCLNLFNDCDLQVFIRAGSSTTIVMAKTTIISLDLTFMIRMSSLEWRLALAYILALAPAAGNKVDHPFTITINCLFNFVNFLCVGASKCFGDIHFWAGVAPFAFFASSFWGGWFYPHLTPLDHPQPIFAYLWAVYLAVCCYPHP